MPLAPLDGFKSIPTHHCITGSMRHVYAYNRHEISEDMLLGIGEGVGFMYWQQKGSPPFIGGRNTPKPSMEEIAGQRTGVSIQSYLTTSARRARESLLEMLASGQPVMLQVDMGFLPYFDFGGQEYHFGGHAIVACGYDAKTGQVLIADRDGLYPVPLADLAKARGSTFKPFPPKNRWYSFDFSHKRLPSRAEIYQAIQAQAQFMLAPPIRSFGIPGIRKAAQAIPQWPSTLSPDEIKWTLFNTYIFISPVGGSGGGNFRYMFSRFLGEAACLAENPDLGESAADFQHIADKWQELSAWFHQASEQADPAAQLKDCVAPLNELADLEQSAWGRLRQLAQ
ncbi:MAG: BtrH N-terminal domain-containing protein [Chloroflexota bacterium]